MHWCSGPVGWIEPLEIHSNRLDILVPAKFPRPVFPHFFQTGETRELLTAPSAGGRMDNVGGTPSAFHFNCLSSR